MISIVICDDDPKMRELLVSYLKRAESDLDEQFQVFEFAFGRELLNDYPHKADILLLDIEMGELNGLDTAKRIKDSIPDICIIFITSYPQYALKSYSVHAFGFLPKPVSYKTLRNELSLAQMSLKKRSTYYIYIKDKNRGTVMQVDIKSICYFEVSDHNIYVVTEKQKLIYRDTLSSLEKELKPYGFFRCHAAYLVNHRFIASIETDLILQNGDVIPISRAKRKEFLTELSKYVGASL